MATARPAQRVQGARRQGLALAALILALCPSAAAAQAAPAVLQGEVRDSTGAPLIAVEVVARDSVEVVARTTTGSNGRYLLRGLVPGLSYSISFTRLGFDARVSRRITLEPGETRRLDVTLSLRPMVLDRIRVVSNRTAVMDPRRTGAVTVVDERAVRTLPTVERDMVALTELSPMVSLDQEAISVAGQNSRFNALRVDGTLAQDLFGLSPSGVPGGQANAKALPMDAIARYSVLVAPFDVRQSGFTGGLIQADTRMGGERWEGAAFGYFRDARFSRVADDSDVIQTYGRGVAEDFETQTGGFTVGGPVGPARLFVAGEVERRSRSVPGFNVGSAEPYRLGLVEDSVRRLASVLEDQYGMEPGAIEGYGLENPLGNLFARLDVPLGGSNRLTVRYNLISAEEDLPPQRLGFDEYQLGSSAMRLESRTHAAAARVTTRLSPRATNELVLSVQRSRDATLPGSDDPLVEVTLTGDQDTLSMRRLVHAGGAPLAHDNTLSQTVAQVADNLSYSVGPHRITGGVEGSLFSARRRFLPGSRGIWRFDSLPALAAGRASSYERLVLAPDADPDVDVSLFQLGAYLQDEWAVTDQLGITLGVRMDVPIARSRPPANEEAEAVTGLRTDRVPSRTPLISPRLGFNWAPGWSWRTQLRGGIGLFAGVPPMAWIADAYAETGDRTVLLICRGGGTPAFEPGASPDTCEGGAPARQDRTLTIFDEDFRYPQDIRGSIAVDQELPGGLVGTVEAVYTRALHQVAVEDVNLPEPAPGPYSPAGGYPPAIGIRPIFGSPLLTPTRFGPLERGRRWPEYAHVMRVGNESRNAALAVAAELQRRFSDRLDLRLAYTYTRAVDTRSLAFPSAALNYGMTPISGHPGEPVAQLASFARTHRVLGSVWARLAEWGDGLDASLLYVGQSGLPYSYVYATDMNGDGFPGPGAAAEAYNDLVFSPRNLLDVPSGIYQTFLMFDLANRDPCLSEVAGMIVGRNVCRTPWSNRVDLRLAQGLSLPFGTVHLTGDLLNVLNLLDRSWGLVLVAPPVVPVLQMTRRSGCPGISCSSGQPLMADYIGPRRLNEETGLPQAALPYTPLLPESQWRAQIGLRVEF